MSNVWNIFQEKLENNQTLTKKALKCLWYPVEDINISDVFYQIQNFLRASWASIITTNGINFLMARPFKSSSLHYLKPRLYYLKKIYPNDQLKLTACHSTAHFVQIALMPKRAGSVWTFFNRIIV